MAAQFQLYRDANASYRFRLVTADGTVMLTSNAFADEPAANAAMAAVRDIAAAGVILDRTDPHPRTSDRPSVAAVGRS